MADDIVKRFETPEGPITAVDHISFKVGPGEFLSVIGPSGCGKSTLFNIIGGLLGDYQGVVSVGGETIAGPHTSIGMVFQEESTFPWRTVIDNVAFPLEIAGMPKAQAHRARAAFHRAGRPRRLREPLSGELSGGMRQRVAIARTLASEPKILLMDEPFAALDEQTRLLLGDKVLQIQQQLQADDAADHPQHHRGGAALRPRAGDDLPARQGEAHRRHRPAAPAHRPRSSAATRSAVTSRRSGATCARKRAAACATRKSTRWRRRSARHDRWPPPRRPSALRYAPRARPRLACRLRR